MWALCSLVLVAALLFGSLALTRARTGPSYQTQPIVRQTLTESVTASGTVNPQNTVNVGTQVSGTISAIYVDYNSKVRQGEVLARLDAGQLQAQVDQAQAQLAQAQAQAGAQSQNAAGVQASVGGAQAGIASAQANVAKAQSALTVARETLSRDRSLLSKGYIAQSQFDADQANEVAAQSAVQSAAAALVQAQAQTATTGDQAGAAADTAQADSAAIGIAQAQVAQDQLNLQHTVITSPIDGLVVARDVSVGQTVAASLQTPTLFEIAQNMHKMEVDISVGEPDIGNVRAGDLVTFSVLAYPNQTFNGTVSQVRVNPTTVNNVVTYTVVTLVNNPQGKLLPGMTANATIDVEADRNALVVPAQAFTFRPAAAGSKGARLYRAQAPASSPWGQTGAGVAGSTSAGGRALIFVDRDGKATPVPVRIDLVSGTQAAVTPLRGTLAAGDEVIVSSGAAPHALAPSSTRATFAGSPGMGGIGRAIH
jgi:HlyD family secretion protein